MEIYAVLAFFIVVASSKIFPLSRFYAKVIQLINSRKVMNVFYNVFV